MFELVHVIQIILSKIVGVLWRIKLKIK